MDTSNLVCTHRHPLMLVLDGHHIQPLAWGGPDSDHNVVDICPNVHRMVHTLLNKYKRLGTVPEWPYRKSYTYQVRRLAEEGWVQTVHTNGNFNLSKLPDL